MSPHRELTYRTVELDGEMGVWHPMELDQSLPPSSTPAGSTGSADQQKGRCSRGAGAAHLSTRKESQRYLQIDLLAVAASTILVFVGEIQPQHAT